ncbi:MAG: hypothetical protein CMD33_10270 [Flavobacteriales bacterium]|nr:hypothetical protein [Flavobacteriales bacterium]
MKHPHHMPIGLSLVFTLIMGIQGCNTPRLAVAGQSCAVEEWRADEFFTQDILPGMESNLRKQRLYFVVGSAEADFNDQSEWLLAMDSVLIPMRVRFEESGAWQWSGSRNFYQPVREGVMSMDEVLPKTSALVLSEAAYLIQRDANKCTAMALPGVRHVGTVAMP